MKKIIILIILLSLHTAAGTAAHETIKENNHVIHVVKIDPQKYEPFIVKAKGQKIGRATVAEMAAYHKAEIGINSGFFDIGNDKDGVATGSLISKGKVFGLKNFTQALFIISGDKLAIRKDNAKKLYKADPQISLVSGIPLLISKSKINEKIYKHKSDYYTKPHARTAIGLTGQGKIILVTVEHPYLKDLSSMTLGEVQSLLKTKNTKKDMTLSEVKTFLKKELTPQNGIKGLTIPELALFMKKQGCISALNLDGGGSSTLFMNGKVVNQTFGDIDEAEGVKIIRPVSDAILFRNKRES